MTNTEAFESLSEEAQQEEHKVIVRGDSKGNIEPIAILDENTNEYVTLETNNDPNNL